MPSFSKDPLSCRFYHLDLVLVGISMLPFETCKRCKDFTPLLLHKDPKSKIQAWDVACPPQPQCVLLVTLHRLCLFPSQSHSWPIPGAPAVLPTTWSVGRFDILKQLLYTNSICRTCFCRRVNYPVWQYHLHKWKKKCDIQDIKYPSRCFAWQSKSQITILENLIHLFSNSL